jgi:hypothetical protein
MAGSATSATPAGVAAAPATAGRCPAAMGGGPAPGTAGGRAVAAVAAFPGEERRSMSTLMGMQLGREAGAAGSLFVTTSPSVIAAGVLAAAAAVTAPSGASTGARANSAGSGAGGSLPMGKTPSTPWRFAVVTESFNEPDAG